jgi:hypothetical protein
VSTDAAPKYTNTRGAAEHLALSASYLEKRRLSGGGPRFIKIGKAVRYRIDELDAWAAARLHGSTSEYSSTA